MTYTYETIEKPHIRFQLQHPMADPALTHHPETGAPIRRLILGAPSFSLKGNKPKLRYEDYKDSHFAKNPV